jgi:hypothetical protein
MHRALAGLLEKVCTEWWAASGPYRGWLASYRQHLAARIPMQEEKRWAEPSPPQEGIVAGSPQTRH